MSDNPHLMASDGLGATRLDPRSDRWTRITTSAGAPCPTDLSPGNAEFRVHPEARS